MATPTATPILVPPTKNYREYFACAKTDNLCCCYATVLTPYVIDTAAAAAEPANVVCMIYDADQEGVPIAFLQ